MNSNNPDLFGIHTQALGLWQRRAEAISNNLANADTPGYKARDVDFRKILAAAGNGSGADGALPLTTTDPRQFSSGQATGGTDAPLAYRTPMQPSMDGNTVDTEIEKAAYAENSVHYQASLSFITGQIRTLRSAITGS